MQGFISGLVLVAVFLVIAGILWLFESREKRGPLPKWLRIVKAIVTEPFVALMLTALSLAMIMAFWEWCRRHWH